MKNIIFSMILVSSSSMVMATDWEAVDTELMNGPAPEVNGDSGWMDGVVGTFGDDSGLVTSESEETDLRLIAEHYGWTVKEAKKHRQSIVRVGRLAESFSKSHSDIFVGAVAPDEWDGNPIIYLKGKVGSSLSMELNAMNIDIIDNQPYSLRELKHQQQKVHSNLADQGYKHIVTSIDILEGVIDAAVTRIDDVSPRPLAMGNVTLTVEDEPVAVLEAAYGGMNAGANGYRFCTTGWPVIYSVYPGYTINGVSTAGHCSGVSQINHPSETHNTYLMREHRGFWGDMEWHLSNEAVTANFYASENDIRKVRSIEPIGNIVVGEPICFYGRFSNRRDCSLRVQNTSTSCNFNDGSGWTGNLIQMNGNVTASGDSGGGWSWGTRAYGSHVGYCSGKNVFTPVDLFDEGMGVRVLTQ